jgi:hypothetical protein
MEHISEQAFGNMNRTMQDTKQGRGAVGRADELSKTQTG